jgi:hypothetical protein
MACNNYCGSSGGSYCGSSYNINSHGDLGAHYNSLINADLPKYTARFYTSNPIFDIKYDKMKLGYDANLRDIRDASRGLPMEAYIPAPVMMPDGVGANSSVIIREPEVMPKKNIIDEILKAQAEVIGNKKPSIKAIRITEIEQEIHLRRRFRKVEIIKNKEH